MTMSHAPVPGWLHVVNTCYMWNNYSYYSNPYGTYVHSHVPQTASAGACSCS